MRLDKLFAGFICSFLLVSSAHAAEKLIFAIDVIRHGDRTPATDMPSAPHEWPEGLGELTSLGMQQEYQLGTGMRSLYVDKYHLLPANYTNGTMYIRSTDYDRTLESAQSLLMGLYPPGTGPVMPDNGVPALPNASQPLPIHTVPQETDTLLIPYNTAAEYQQLLQQYVMNTPEWQTKTQSLQPKFQAWSEATGLHITNLLELAVLGDILNVEQIHNVPVPAGLSAEDAQQIIDARQWSMVHATANINVAAAIGQNLLKAIVADLQMASQQKSALKYVLFSAHDSTLLAEMSLLNTPLDEVPHYASDLNFLLFEEKPDTYVVKINFNGQLIQIPGCNTACPLNQFIALINSAENAAHPLTSIK